MINNQEPKWPKQRKIKWLINTITIIAVILLFGTLFIFGNTFFNKYEAIEDMMDGVYSPYWPKEITILNAPNVINDRINWDYDKYHEKMYEQVAQQNTTADNYQMQHVFSLYVDDLVLTIDDEEEKFKYDITVQLNINGRYGEGHIVCSGISKTEYLSFPIYTINKENFHTVYIKFNEKWSKFDIDNNTESVLTLTPQKMLESIKDADFVNIPSDTFLHVRARDLDYGFYKFVAVNGCMDSGYNATPIRFYSSFNNDSPSGFLYRVSRQKEAPLNYKVLIDFAKQKDDKVILHILENYPVYYCEAGSFYQDYNEIPEIEIPDEISEAEYMTSEDIEVLQQKIIVNFEKEVSYARECE